MAIVSRKRISQFVQFFVVRLLVAVIQVFPLESCARMARIVVFLVHDVLGIRHQTIDENLAHVFPEWTVSQRQAVARAMWRHLYLMVCEIAHAQRLVHETNWRRYLRVHNKELMVRVLLDPRPTVLVSGHIGNFEMASFTTGLLGFPAYAIAKPIENPYLDRFIKSVREAKGQFLLPYQDSAAMVQRVLRSGGLLSLLGDQHAGQRGCWVNFLGRPASCHKALALFTLAEKAPMVVGFARRLERPLQLEVGCVAVADPKNMDSQLSDVRRLTQWYNDRLEEVIRQSPDQYWWLHRRWKTRPGRRAGRLASGKAA